MSEQNGYPEGAQYTAENGSVFALGHERVAEMPPQSPEDLIDINAAQAEATEQAVPAHAPEVKISGVESALEAYNLGARLYQARAAALTEGLRQAA